MFIYPGLLDPRWTILPFLLSFDVFALTSPGFSRSPVQFAAGVGTCLFLDSAILFLIRKLWLAPVSGFISSLGLLLLCDSPFVWPYAAVGAISILSKHLIRSEGRHMFNPLNFGIVFGLLFFSREMTVVAGRWGGSLSGMLVVVSLGVLAAYRARRLDLSLAYVLTFLAGVFVRCALKGAPFWSVAAPMTGAAFMLFTFYMITDPMTTPETRRGRIIFGVAVALLDTVLRYYQVNFSPFYALFALSAFMPFFRHTYAPKAPERVWMPRSLTL